MANGIGRVWAANAGDDEQRPNGVGSVWIENIDALAPSGGASEQQINELSAAIDYVSANAGDPNALTGYQNGGEISADGSFFEAKGPSYDLIVGYGGTLKADNSCSAVFTNGSIVSADCSNGFFVKAGDRNTISACDYGLNIKNYYYDIKADDFGLDISSYYGNMPFKYRTDTNNIKLNSNGFAFDSSSRNYSAWIDYNGTYGVSGTNYIGSFGGWRGEDGGVKGHWVNGVGFSGGFCNFGVYNAGKLIVCNQGELNVRDGGKLSANNSCSALFTNGSRTEITNGHTLLVGNNDKGTGHGIVVSGNGNEFIKIYNAGSVKVVDGNEVNLSGSTHKIGTYLNASGSRFVSADGEGVSAWSVAPMTVMGAYNKTSSNAAFVVGNGSGSNARSDLFVIDYSGNAKSKDFVAESAPVVHTVTGTMTTSFTPPGVEQYYYEPILSGDIGVDLTKVLFNVDLSNLDAGLQQMIVYENGSTGENMYNWYNKITSFKQNFEQPFSTSSTFTGYSSIEGDPSSLESVSSIRFVLDTDITIPYTATWVEEAEAPKSLTGLYNSFTAYTANVPNIQMVSTSSEATGANILYVVTGSN